MTGKSSRRSTGGSRSFSVEASQNQMVPYGRGRSSGQKGDLSSMALTLAFGNGGNVSKLDITGNNAVMNLLHTIGRRSMESRKMESKSSFNVYNPSNRAATMSNLHITEISKGVQKLNQIITACSNGFTVNGYSAEVGKELLRGAIDLEESLRVLVDMQEASNHVIRAQRRNKIRLLDEEEEEDEERSIVKITDKRQVERPRFSFDKPSKSSHGTTREPAKSYIKQHLMALTYPDEGLKSGERKTPSTSDLVRHKRSASCVPDFRTASTSSETPSCSSLPPPKPEKGRISNVVAKLMGLEELPQKEEQICKQKELSSKRKEGTVSRRSLSSADTLIIDTENRPPSTMNKGTTPINNARSTRDSIYPSTKNKGATQVLDTQATKDPMHVLGRENTLAAPHSGSRKIVSRENGVQEIKMAVRTDVASSPHHNCSHTSRTPVYHKTSRGHEKEAIKTQKIEYLTKEILSQKELHQKLTKKHTTLQEGNEPQDDSLCKIKTGHTEKKSTARLYPGKQHKHQYNQESPRLQRLKDLKHQDEKIREKPLARQNVLSAECKRSHIEPAISQKPKSCAIISRKKLPGGVQDTSRRKKLISSGDSMPLKNLPKSIQTTSVQAPIIPEKPRKSEAVANIRNETARHLSSPLEIQSPVLQVVKQQENKNIRDFEEPGQLRENQFQEVEAGVNGLIESDERVELLNGIKDGEILAAESIHNEPSSTGNVGSRVNREDDECHCLEIPETPLSSVKDNAIEVDDICYDQQDVEQPSNSPDEELHTENDLLENCEGTLEESIETNSQLNSDDEEVPLPCSEELLTHHEKHLKEMLVKSQLFLNTTEALFKLNMPINILHSNGDNRGCQDAEFKLTLDCAYEVIRRKGRRQELMRYHHPCSIVTIKITSLDDLIKQLCKDFDALNLYGGIGNDLLEYDAAEYLRKMLEKDMMSGLSDVNSMWDYGWNGKTFAFLERHEIMMDVEKHMLNGLLDEITCDLLDF